LIPISPGWLVVFEALACASNSTFGTGCNGLTLASNNPVLGGMWTITTSGIDAISPLAITVFAASPQSPVPLPVLGFDAPGCFVNVTGLLADASGPNVGGSTVLSAPIPLNASLKNASVVMQSVALSPANPAGLATSNGAGVVVGW